VQGSHLNECDCDSVHAESDEKPFLKTAVSRSTSSPRYGAMLIAMPPEVRTALLRGFGARPPGHQQENYQCGLVASTREGCPRFQEAPDTGSVQRPSRSLIASMPSSWVKVTRAHPRSEAVTRNVTVMSYPLTASDSACPVESSQQKCQDRCGNMHCFPVECRAPGAADVVFVTGTMRRMLASIVSHSALTFIEPAGDFSVGRCGTHAFVE
jgi:hypothetical protein